MTSNGSSTPVYLVFDDASEEFSFEPQGAWLHEDPVAEQERYRGYGDGIRHTHPGLREANQSATVTLDSPQIAENRAIRLFGRVYGQTTNQNATQDLIIQYRLLDDEPATNQAAFSPNANVSIDYGVSVADEKANLEGSRIIVDDFDFDEIAFFGGWSTIYTEAETTAVEGLVEGEETAARQGYRIPFNYTAHLSTGLGSGFRFRFYGRSVDFYGCYILRNTSSTIDITYGVAKAGARRLESTVTMSGSFDAPTTDGQRCEPFRTYQPTDDQPGISFSEDAFAAINFGVAVAGEDVKMNETHIIVDDADTSQLLYFGDWNEDDEADDFSEREGLVVGNNAQVRVGPRISYNGTRRATSIERSGFKFRFWGHDLHIYGCFNLSRPDSRVVLNGLFQEMGKPDVGHVWVIESPSNIAAPLNGTRYCETGHIVGMGFGATSEDEPKEMILTLHAIAVSPNPESASFVFDYLTYQPVFQRLSEKPQWDLKQLESDYVWKKPGPSKGTIIGASVGGSLGFLLIVGLVVLWVIKKRRGTREI